jgi:hypothetical protein
LNHARRPRKWFRGRNYALGAQLDTFLVCAASGVMLNRVILIVLGYPQVGSRKPDGIHISHSIYGGFSMMVAISIAIAFLHPSVRWFLAVVAGLGFGWYIDELGKYVSNAGYLFEPALALIYVVFVAMFLAFRTLANQRFGPDDAVANALESLKAAALGTLDDAPSTPTRSPGPLRRLRTAVRERYEGWTRRRSFAIALDAFFGFVALSTVLGVVGLSLDGPGIVRPSEKVASIAASAAGIMVVIGVVRLPRSRLAAYRWFEHAVLIWILVVQVYLFGDRQFEAVLGLAFDLVLWVMLRSAITVEEQREHAG